MSKRLSDKRLADIETFGRMNDGDVKRWLGLSESVAMAAELRERRAADLTADVIEYLLAIVEHSIAQCRAKFGEDVSLNPDAIEAARVLSRLVERKP